MTPTQMRDEQGMSMTPTLARALEPVSPPNCERARAWRWDTPARHGENIREGSSQAVGYACSTMSRTRPTKTSPQPPHWPRASELAGLPHERGRSGAGRLGLATSLSGRIGEPSAGRGGLQREVGRRPPRSTHQSTNHRSINQSTNPSIGRETASSINTSINQSREPLTCGIPNRRW